MAIVYNTGIVRSGLVLHLDAANVKSYPGSGTVWKDLSGDGNNGTLVNGVTYNSNNKGGMVFDGVDDSVSGSFSSIIDPNQDGATYIIVAKSAINYTEYGVYRNITNFTSTEATTHFGLLVEPDTRGLRFDWPSNTNARIGVNSNVTVGTNIFFAAYSWKNSISKVYVNGLLINQTSHASYTSANITGYRLSNFGPRWQGNIYCYLVYKKELSLIEVQNNFNALRGRYGI